MGNGWRIGFVENEASYREFLSRASGSIEDVGSYRFWNSAEDILNESDLNLDVLFVDIMLTGMDGTELCSVLSEKYPDLRIVMLTGLSADDSVFKALTNGAIGYILKSDLSSLEETIRIIMDGGAIITPTIALRVVKSFKPSVGQQNEVLSDREKEVLDHLVKGNSTQKVSEILDISIHTVRYHIKNIYQKLHVKNRVDLYKKATGVLE